MSKGLKVVRITKIVNGKYVWVAIEEKVNQESEDIFVLPLWVEWTVNGICGFIRRQFKCKVMFFHVKIKELIGEEPEWRRVQRRKLREAGDWKKQAEKQILNIFDG